MHIERLVTMANDIGNFFAAEPDRMEALAGIKSHIARFWEKRMRAQIFAHIAERQGEGLSPLVKDALTDLAAEQAHPAQPTAAMTGSRPLQ